MYSKKKTTKSNTKKKSNNKKISKTSTKSSNSTKTVKKTEPIVKKVVEVKTIKEEQPKKKPNILLYVGILLTIAVLVIILVVIFLPKKDATNDGLKHNTNKSFTEDKVVNGIIFKNIKCTFDGKDSTISYTMINKTTDIINLNNYDIIIKDKEGTRLTKISIHITDAIKSLESLDRVDKVIGIDLSDAYEMELIVNTNE